MIKRFAVSLCLIALGGCALAQGPRPGDLGASKLDLGEPGIHWYTTWESAAAEAKRSGRPIMFVAAATQCHGVSGVFWPGYTATQNGLFASPDFIDASRDFVCVRLDSYESAEHQTYVRTFLNGSFANSAFCMLAPDGQEWLTRAGRGPEMVLGRNGATESLQRFALMYPSKADPKQALVQDFHTVRQALNVASADQRVLVVINAPAEQAAKLRQSLRAVASDQAVVGRFHFDFEQALDWKENITGTTQEPGIVLIHPGEFGLKGKVLKQLPLDASSEQIIASMVQANTQFAATTQKKVYSEHVAKGNRQGIYFEGAVPYGEDRDGDGQVDGRGGGRGRGGGGRGAQGRGRPPGAGGQPR